MGKSKTSPRQTDPVKDAEKLLKQVMESLENYISANHPEEDLQQPAAATTTKKEHAEQTERTHGKSTRTEDPDVALTSFLIDCESFLKLKPYKYFTGVVAGLLLQASKEKPAKRNIFSRFQAVMSQDPKNEMEFELIAKVFDLMNVVLEAYTKHLGTFAAEGISELELDCPAMLKALEKLIYLVWKWNDERQDLFVEIFFDNQLLDKLIKLKSRPREAGRVFFGFWVLVGMELGKATMSTTRRDKFIKVQERLITLLGTEEFLWQRLGDNDGAIAITCKYGLLRGLSANGWEAQSAIMLGLLGLLCQGGDAKLCPVTPSAQTRIRDNFLEPVIAHDKVVITKGGFTALWSLLLTESCDGVISSAGIVALYNLIQFIGAEKYTKYVQNNEDALHELQNMNNELLTIVATLKDFTKNIVAPGCTSFFQCSAAFLLIILSRTVLLKKYLPDPDFTTEDMRKLKEVLDASRSLSASNILMCRVMGGRL